MSEWLAVLTFMFGGGGLLTGILAWRRDARQGPVDVSTAQVADAIAISEAAGSWVKYQDQKLKEQELRFDEYDRRLTAQESKLMQVNAALSDWGGWYQDLKVRWPIHRQLEAPPAAPNYSGHINTFNKEDNTKENP